LPRFDEYTLQTLGFGLIVLGIFLFMLGLIGGPQWSMLPVPLPWYYWIGTASFSSGIALLSIGIILLTVARSMNTTQVKGKWVDARVPGRSESRFWIPERHVMTLGEAKALADGCVVMEGDYGGQCYLTAPMRIVACQENELGQLLQDLDEIFWQDVEGRHLYYEQHRSGDRIDSGMGGGLILDDTWIHKQLIEFGLETKIREVLSGKLSSLGLSDGEIGRLRGRLLSIEERSKYLDY